MTQPPTLADGRRGRRLPIWAWVLILLAILVVAVLVGIRLAMPGSSNADPDPSPTLSSTVPTVPTVDPAPSPSSTPDPVVDQGTFASEMYEHMFDILYSQDTGPLAVGGTFSDPILVVTASTGAVESMSALDAARAVEDLFTPLDPVPWDLALAESTLDGYRAGPYGAYFPDGSIVARSADGNVVSFLGNDRTITTVLIAASEDMLH